MEKRETSKDVMFIQDKTCAFGKETNYQEDGETYMQTVTMTHGELKTGETFTIILHPFDVLAVGLVSTQN